MEQEKLGAVAEEDFGEEERTEDARIITVGGFSVEQENLAAVAEEDFGNEERTEDARIITVGGYSVEQEKLAAVAEEDFGKEERTEDARTITVGGFSVEQEKLAAVAEEDFGKEERTEDARIITVGGFSMEQEKLGAVAEEGMASEEMTDQLSRIKTNQPEQATSAAKAVDSNRECLRVSADQKDEALSAVELEGSATELVANTASLTNATSSLMFIPRGLSGGPFPLQSPFAVRNLTAQLSDSSEMSDQAPELEMESDVFGVGIFFQS